jgi:hypothetical protein
MKYANFFITGHQKNSPFMEIDSVHQYGTTYLWRHLRDKFLLEGLELNTPDINNGKLIDFEIYVDGQQLSNSTVPKYLLALENPLINPLSADLDYGKKFNHVFSWNPKLSALKNFTLLMVPNELRTRPFLDFSQRPFFSCLINANKRFPRQIKNDLYEERLRLIKWYEINHPKEFNLYGLGWEKPSPAFTKNEKFMRRIKRLRSQIFGYKPFPSFRGSVADKFSVYSVSKFAFCYENASDLPNYITEKIFDAMIAGCVPVYWGADNILDYIPEDCFIDRRSYKDNASLHAALKGISDDQYATFQNRIYLFLNGKGMSIFTAEYYVEKLITKILCNLSGDAVKEIMAVH